jgi:DNA invertase Pin-like site-specific DNA recombinase
MDSFEGDGSVSGAAESGRAAGRRGRTGESLSVRIVGYCRLSKSEDGHGIAVQRRAIEEHCARQGFELLRVEVDDGASGRSTKKRPGLARAIEACRTGEADGLAAAKLDRVTRSLLDFATLVEDAQRHGYALVVIDQGFDLSTPHGKAMAGMLAVFAQYERDMISARTRSALAHVKRNGSRSGRPIGNPNFLSVSAATGARILELRETGLSYRRIAERLNEENVPTAQGGKCWYARTIQNIVARMSSSITAGSSEEIAA